MSCSSRYVQRGQTGRKEALLYKRIAELLEQNPGIRRQKRRDPAHRGGPGNGHSGNGEAQYVPKWNALRWSRRFGARAPSLPSVRR